MIAEHRLQKEIFHFQLPLTRKQLIERKEAKTESQNVQGLDWRVECLLDAESEEMAVHLRMAKPLTGMYMMECGYQMTLADSNKVYVLEYESQGIESLSLLESPQLNVVPMPLSYFIGDDDILNLHVTLRVYRMKIVDLSKPSKFCDVALKMRDGQLVHVSKTLLSLHSPVFERLFASVCFKQNEDNVYELGVDHWPLMVVLYTLYGMIFRFKDVQQQTLRDAMQIAHHYRIDVSLRVFEEHLLSLPESEILDLFGLADQFGMFRVVHKIVALSGKEELRRIFNEYGLEFSYNACQELTARLMALM